MPIDAVSLLYVLSFIQTQADVLGCYPRIGWARAPPLKLVRGHRRLSPAGMSLRGCHFVILGVFRWCLFIVCSRFPSP